jgi:dolichol-phosphate mannosyltransferase
LLHLSIDSSRIAQQESSRPLQLAVVVPTFNEADNVAEFLNRLELALAGIEWEAIFVDDDSSDGTSDLVRAIALEDRRVRIVHRYRRRGLAGAVVEGALASSAPLIAVMDADLQHDHFILPQMLATASEGYDLVIGSRYTQNGSTGDWDARREAASRWSTQVAKRVLKVELSDPMSGFFVIRREAFMASLPRISGDGFKILLDIVASAPKPLRVAEVPFTFGVRTAGKSKLELMVVCDYAKLLADKTVGRILPITLLLFLGVGSLGVFVQLGALFALRNLTALDFFTSQCMAVACAMTFNFSLNNIFTYSDRRLKGWRFLAGLAKFCGVCLMGAIANVGIGSYIYGTGSVWWLAAIAGSLVGAVWNYAASSALVWRR